MSCAKTAEPIDMPYGMWTKEACRPIRWDAQWHHLANTIAPSMLGDNAAFCQTRTSLVKVAPVHFSNNSADRKKHTAAVTYLRFWIQVCFSILSVCRPRPASHAYFRHWHIPELISGVDSSITLTACFFLFANIKQCHRDRVVSLFGPQFSHLGQLSNSS